MPPRMPTSNDRQAEGATDRYRLIGAGIYTIPEASRLTGIPARNIRRWALGYIYTSGGETHLSPPIVTPQLAPIDGTSLLSFRDLQEVRFLQAFRDARVSWQTLRLAAERARERLGRDHPFSTGRFKAFARRILIDVAGSARDRVLEDIVSSQLAFRKVISPYLQGLEFDRDEVVRWFPRRHKRIVIDPVRSFGQPIVTKEGVPTRVLAQAYAAERSLARVARRYEVDLSSVRAAVDYERPRKAA